MCCVDVIYIYIYLNVYISLDVYIHVNFLIFTPNVDILSQKQRFFFPVVWSNHERRER